MLTQNEGTFGPGPQQHCVPNDCPQRQPDNCRARDRQAGSGPHCWEPETPLPHLLPRQRPVGAPVPLPFLTDAIVTFVSSLKPYLGSCLEQSLLNSRSFLRGVCVPLSKCLWPLATARLCFGPQRWAH